jgi:hypothetical protein
MRLEPQSAQKRRRSTCRFQESDIADSSFIDALERSGFIDRLYAAGK